MRGSVAMFAVVFGWATAAGAGAIDCAGWMRLDDSGKSAAIAGMIDRHLSSNAGRSFTSENKVAMRRCLEGFAERIRDDLDNACAEGKSTGKSALDDIFDRYLLSCVQ